MKESTSYPVNDWGLSGASEASEGAFGGCGNVPPGSYESLLTGEKVHLRGIVPDDLEFLYRWENDPKVWQWGDCGVTAPYCDAGNRDKPGERFSREELREFIENQQYDIFVTGQSRFVICRRDCSCGAPVGFIDLFDFDPVGLSAGVGILICDPVDRRKGYGGEALKLVSEYARQVLGLCTLWCSVDADNDASITFFSDANFERAEVGIAGNEKTLDFRQELASLFPPQRR